MRNEHLFDGIGDFLFRLFFSSSNHLLRSIEPARNKRKLLRLMNKNGSRLKLKNDNSQHTNRQREMRSFYILLFMTSAPSAK